jgi:hypothetical protein
MRGAGISPILVLRVNPTHGGEKMSEPLYVIGRNTEIRPARFEKRWEEERESRQDGVAKALDDTGGELLGAYGTYSNRGMMVLMKFPDLEAWNTYRKAVVAPGGVMGPYHEWEFELCFEIRRD